MWSNSGDKKAPFSSKFNFLLILDCGPGDCDDDFFFSLLRLHWKEAAFRQKLSPDGSQQAGGLSEKKLRTKKWYLFFPPERQSFKSVGRTESAEWNGKLNKQIYDYLIRQFMGHNCRKKFYFTISYGFFHPDFPCRRRCLRPELPYFASPPMKGEPHDPQLIIFWLSFGAVQLALFRGPEWVDFRVKLANAWEHHCNCHENQTRHWLCTVGSKVN